MFILFVPCFEPLLLPFCFALLVSNCAASCCQHTPLNAPGIYIRTLIPDGPAASDGRLRIGDRILAVNGTSLIGADYQRYSSQQAEVLGSAPPQSL